MNFDILFFTQQIILCTFALKKKTHFKIFSGGSTLSPPNKDLVNNSMNCGVRNGRAGGVVLITAWLMT